MFQVSVHVQLETRYQVYFSLSEYSALSDPHVLQGFSSQILRIARCFCKLWLYSQQILTKLKLLKLFLSSRSQIKIGMTYFLQMWHFILVSLCRVVFVQKNSRSKMDYISVKKLLELATIWRGLFLFITLYYIIYIYVNILLSVTTI